jgi:hypothetical protein
LQPKAQAWQCLGFFSPYNRAVNSSSTHRVLTLLIVAAMLGLLSDLLLIGHDEDALQFIPLLALGLGSAALVLSLLTHSRAVINIGRVILILIAASGLVGLWLHYRANAGFQLEMDPSLAGFDLLWKTLRTKSPPAIAPGQMVLLSLMALLVIRPGKSSPKGPTP